MKLNEVMEKKNENENKGTYAGVRFDDDTVSRVKAFAVQHEIPNRVPRKSMHSTVLYSRKFLPEYKPAGEYEEPLTGAPTQFNVWESQPDEDGKKSNCLVLEYDCPRLVDRHKSLMDEHEAEYDYDEYKPHMTLSYDIGDLDVSKFDPSAVGDLNIVNEYDEELNFDWAKDNT